MAQLIRFALVGGVGFLVDTGVLYLCLYNFSFGYFLGRFISYLCASSVTWYLHGIYTFKQDSSKLKKSQLLTFVIFNSIGGLANYIVYALLVVSYAFFRAYPVAAVGVGAVLGLIINYHLSKKVVFRID